MSDLLIGGVFSFFVAWLLSHLLARLSQHMRGDS